MPDKDDLLRELLPRLKKMHNILLDCVEPATILEVRQSPKNRGIINARFNEVRQLMEKFEEDIK